MILPALSLLLHASAIDSSQRIVATLLDSIQRSSLCKQVVPVSPSSLPSTLDRGGDAKIHTVACPNGLRKTVVRWEAEKRPYDRDLYLEDFHGLLFVHSTQLWSLTGDADDSLVEHWLYRTPGGSLAYSSTGSARTVRSTQFDSGLANSADRIFWKEGRYRSLSDSQARSMGMNQGFWISPHKKCKPTRFPLSTARRTWDLLASGLNLRMDSASLVTLDELRCQDMSSFVVGQADFPHHRSQITIGRRWDSLKFILHRRQSPDQEYERILIPEVSRAQTWWRASERLDAVFPDFVHDSTSPTAKGLLEILGQTSRLPNARAIDSLREDSVKLEVIRRQAAIDQAIRQRRCEELPADPLPALEPLANKNLGEANARIILCPHGIGSRFVQSYDSTETPLEIRLDATEQGLLAIGRGRPDKANSRLERNWFELDGIVRSMEARKDWIDPRKPDRRTFDIDPAAWRWIDSTFTEAVPDFPNQMIALDGFLFLEASPEITSNRPIRRRGDWNFQEIDPKSVPTNWSKYRKKTFRTWGGDPRRLDTIVGFCLVWAAATPGSLDADEASTEEPSVTTYLAAKLSGNADLYQPRLVGLSALLPDKIKAMPDPSDRFTAWTRVLEEKMRIDQESRLQQEFRRTSYCEDVSTPKSKTPEFGQPTWNFGDSRESYFLVNLSQDRNKPCGWQFDASYQIAALEDRAKRVPPFRDVFAPPEPDLPTLAESEFYQGDPEPGMREITHPCSDFDSFECGIHDLSKAKPGRRIQALVESRGEMHRLELREWDGSHWTSRFTIDRPQEVSGPHEACD